MENLQLPHKLTLNDRKTLSVTGVTEVVSFDDTAIVLGTVGGILEVLGQDLVLKTLSIEGGQVAVDGTVNGLYYRELRHKSGFWGRRDR